MSPLTLVMSTCLGGLVNGVVSPAFYAEVDVFDPPQFQHFQSDCGGVRIVCLSQGLLTFEKMFRMSSRPLRHSVSPCEKHSEIECIFTNRHIEILKLQLADVEAVSTWRPCAACKLQLQTGGGKFSP